MQVRFIFILALFMCNCKQNPGLSNEPVIISRTEWGSIPAEHETPPHEISYITIHHGGVVFKGDKPTDQYLRDLQAWSRSEKNWIDIPYHYVMDLGGIIYEARPADYPGDTNTDYDPTGHLLICILGNYEEQELSSEQYTSLVNFLVYFSRKFHIPPDKIKSHKDYTETACPGKNIYKYIEDGSLMKAVEEKLKN